MNLYFSAFRAVIARAAIACSAMMFAGCSAELYDLMGRTSSPPAEAAPSVALFETPLALRVSWDADGGADEYLVYRDTSLDGGFTTLVYAGTLTSFLDAGLSDNFWYYYRLDKRRGKEMFVSEVYGYGVGSVTTKDEFEPNNTKETATPFVNTLMANIFYYQDGRGSFIEDIDWYAVTVGPRTRYTFVIDMFENLADEDITFNLETIPIDTIFENEGYSIKNWFYEPRTFYFRIAPNRGVYVTDTEPMGGKLGSYRIKFDNATDVESL